MVRVNETINSNKAVSVGNNYSESNQFRVYTRAIPAPASALADVSLRTNRVAPDPLWLKANVDRSMPMPMPINNSNDNDRILPRQVASRCALNSMSVNNMLSTQQTFLLQNEAQALSVSFFVQGLNEHFKSLGDFFVKGEVSSCKDQQHLYFSIKDERASINCVMYKRNRDAIGFVPKIGQTVLVLANNSIYAKNGSFSLLVKNMVLAGNGMLMEMLRLREQKLEQEGLFARKRPLPKIMGSVAVVTSLDGRARYDLTMNALRRNPFIRLAIFETKVQGQDAVDSIVETLNFIYKLVNLQRYSIDVIVLTRGGGSFEDLLCFSEEEVVRAVARSPIPIISAIGHDEDCPICDRAADLRVSTPTAAAEAVTPITRQSMLNYLYDAIDRADNAIFSKIDQYQFICMNLLERCKFNRNISFMLDSLQARMNAVQTMLAITLNKQLDWRYNKFADCEHRLMHHGLLERLRGYGYRLQKQQKVLDTINYRLSDTERRFSYCVNRLRSSQICSGLVERNSFKLSKLNQRLNSAIERYLNSAQQRLQNCEIGLDFLPEKSVSGQITVRDLPRSFEFMTKHAQERLRSLDQSLLQLNPLYQLERGLSLTTLDGIHSVKVEELKQGSQIVTLLQGAKVYSTVTKSEKWDMVSLDEIKLNAELEVELDLMLNKRAATKDESGHGVKKETALKPKNVVEPEPLLGDSAKETKDSSAINSANDTNAINTAETREIAMGFALEQEGEIEKIVKKKRTRAKKATTDDADNEVEDIFKPKSRSKAKTKV